MEDDHNEDGSLFSPNSSSIASNLANQSPQGAKPTSPSSVPSVPDQLSPSNSTPASTSAPHADDILEISTLSDFSLGADVQNVGNPTDPVTTPFAQFSQSSQEEHSLPSSNDTSSVLNAENSQLSSQNTSTTSEPVSCESIQSTAETQNAQAPEAEENEDLPRVCPLPGCGFNFDGFSRHEVIQHLASHKKERVAKANSLLAEKGFHNLEICTECRQAWTIAHKTCGFSFSWDLNQAPITDLLSSFVDDQARLSTLHLVGTSRKISQRASWIYGRLSGLLLARASEAQSKANPSLDDKCILLFLHIFPALILNVNRHGDATTETILARLKVICDNQLSEWKALLDQALSQRRFPSFDRRFEQDHLTSQAFRRADRYMSSALLSRASNAIFTRQIPVKPSPANDDKLKSKFTLSDDEDQSFVIDFNEDELNPSALKTNEVEWVLDSLSKQSAAGPFGMTAESLAFFPVNELTSFLSPHLVGKANEYARCLFASYYVTSIAKPNRDLRPISVSTIFNKALDKIVTRRLGPTVRSAIGAISKGIGEKAGCEAIIRSCQASLDISSSNVVAGLDVTNCFGNIDRQTLFSILARHNLHAYLPFFQGMYGRPNKLYHKDHTGSTSLLGYMGNGIPQGNPSSPLLASLVMYEATKDSRLEIEGQGGALHTYIDDTFFHGPIEALQTFLTRVPTDLANFQLECNPTKSFVLDPHEKAKYVLEAINYQGTFDGYYRIILGAPVFLSSDEASIGMVRQHLTKHVDDSIKDMAELIKYSNAVSDNFFDDDASVARRQCRAQSAFNVLLRCVHPRLNFLARTVSPAVFAEAAHRFDDAVVKASLKLLLRPDGVFDPSSNVPGQSMCDIEDFTMDHMRLAKRHGGQGLFSYAKLSPHAFVSAFNDVMRLSTSGSLPSKAIDSLRRLVDPSNTVAASEEFIEMLQDAIDCGQQLVTTLQTDTNADGEPQVDNTAPAASLFPSKPTDLGTVDAKLQRRLMGKLNDAAKLDFGYYFIPNGDTQPRLADRYNDNVIKALHDQFVELQAPGTSDFYLALPVSKRFSLEQVEFRLGVLSRMVIHQNHVKRFLGISPSFKCHCGSSSIRHLQTCSKAGGGNAIARHDAVVNLLFETLPLGGATKVIREPNNIIDTSKQRPDLALRHKKLKGRGSVLVDVVVSSAKRPRNSSNVPTAVAKAAEDRKWALYRKKLNIHNNRQLQKAFTPFALQTTGGYSPNTLSFLSAVFNNASLPSQLEDESYFCVPSLRMFVRVGIAVAVTRGVAANLVHFAKWTPRD